MLQDLGLISTDDDSSGEDWEDEDEEEGEEDGGENNTGYTCGFCDLDFQTEAEIKSHMTQHSGMT